MRICLLCGGQSSEHEISLLSARNVLSAMPREYEVLVVGIDKQGNWFWYPDGKYAEHLEGASEIRLAETGRVSVFPVRKDARAVLTPLEAGYAPQPFDLLFPMLHGKNGEDGTVQALAQLLGCPCVGCHMTASAVGMDKAFTKRIVEDEGVRTAHWVEIRRTDKSLPDVSHLGMPLFVKPANAGSSVGVVKVTRPEELSAAVAEALKHDTKALIEECITGREIECAVLGNEEPFCPRPGEIVSAVDFYSYDAKYTMSDGATVIAPADLPAEKAAVVQKIACKVYRILGCRGMARVDFFLTPSGEWVFNEINTIPGFTNISMYPKLMNAGGISSQELLRKLVAFALED